jgi:hypothetical protein
MKTVLHTCSLLLLACATCHLALADDLPEKKHPVPQKTPPKPEPHEAGRAVNKETVNPVHRPQGKAAAVRAGAPAAGPSPKRETPERPRWTEIRVDANLHPRAAVVFTGPPWIYDRAYESEAGMLRLAYLALSRADHDYAGHRALAMRQTALAGDLLGLHLRGDGRGEESQDVSDSQLKVAGNILSHAYDRLAEKGHREAAGHVGAAINEIRIALHFN